MSNVKTAGMRLLAAAMAVCMAVAVAVMAAAVVPTQAYAATNQDVLDQRSGVFKFNWGIDGKESARGSAFLINEDTVVTAHHCVMPSSTEFEIYERFYGMTRDEILERCSYSVTIAGDFQVPATLEKYSEKQDIAILKLDQKLNNVKSLTLRDSSDVDASEQVYALGFPVAADQNAVVTFTSNDVTVTDGTVSKPEGQMNYMDNTLAERSGSFIMSTCRMEGGSSGGPMVDSDGHVIGVCVMGDSTFYYAAASDVLMEALDTMAYEYTKADDSGSSTTTATSKSDSSASASKASAPKLKFTSLNAAITRAEGLNAADYSEDSYKAVTAALAVAKEAQNTELADDADEDEFDEAQATIDDAETALTNAINGLQPAPTGPSPAIIAIIVAAVVIIAIIVIVLVMRSRKKKGQADAPTTPLNNGQASAPSEAASAAQPALASGGSQSWQKPGSAASGAAVAETTILDDEASDTVILFQAASGGSLTRMSTNEQIPINSAEFTIGRERSKVNYCLEGNSSISRVHVRFVVRDGKVYVVDNKAANGTYVNGVKLRPGEEQLLKGGDIVTLADEKFKYNA